MGCNTDDCFYLFTQRCLAHAYFLGDRVGVNSGSAEVTLYTLHDLDKECIVFFTHAAEHLFEFAFGEILKALARPLAIFDELLDTDKISARGERAWGCMNRHRPAGLRYPTWP